MAYDYQFETANPPLNNPDDRTSVLSGINIILGSVSASANAYSFLVNRTAIGKAAHLKLTDAAKMGMTGSNLIAFCDRFATVLSYFAAAESAMLAEKAYNDARYEDATKDMLASASLVAVTLGAQILAGGGFVFAGCVPGVGWALVVAGAIVQVAIVTWDLWMDNFVKLAIQIKYSVAYEQLLQSPHAGEYTGKMHWQRVAYVDLLKPMAVLTENRGYKGAWGIWKKLSWHAVIPLYLQQRDNGLSVEDLLDNLSEFVDIDDELLRKLIEFYELNENLIKGDPMKCMSEEGGYYIKTMLAALACGEYSPHPRYNGDDVLSNPCFRTLSTIQGPKLISQENFNE